MIRTVEAKSPAVCPEYSFSAPGELDREHFMLPETLHGFSVGVTVRVDAPAGENSIVRRKGVEKFLSGRAAGAVMSAFQDSDGDSTVIYGKLRSGCSNFRIV